MKPIRGRDAFHRVRNLRLKKSDAVKRVPTQWFTAQMHARQRTDSSHEPEGRARHSVRAAAWQWANGAQGTDAPYQAGRFMATMRDFEIVKATHEPDRGARFGRLRRSAVLSRRNLPRS